MVHYYTVKEFPKPHTLKISLVLHLSPLEEIPWLQFTFKMEQIQTLVWQLDLFFNN